jgi:hypothetical protein
MSSIESHNQCVDMAKAIMANKSNEYGDLHDTFELEYGRKLTHKDCMKYTLILVERLESKLH